jgi:hypothetical protein
VRLVHTKTVLINSLPSWFSFNVPVAIVFAYGTRTYYRWLPDAAPATFSAAARLCAAAPLYDLNGTLAVLRSETDDLALRALKPSGWIGASSSAGAVWSWRTAAGPVPFWRGISSLGVPEMVPATAAAAARPMYAQWAVGEPASASSYAVIDEAGFWRAVGPAAAVTGVVCQYGSPADETRLAIAGVRNMIPAGCFVAPCLQLTAQQCAADRQCVYASGKCVLDVRCALGATPARCTQFQSCFWDYALGACTSEPVNVCSATLLMPNCTAMPQCAWNARLLPTQPNQPLGACAFQGCAVHPIKNACEADPLCKWSGNGPCLRRLCGYQAPAACWRDALCTWAATPAASSCEKSPCLAHPMAAACGAADSCAWNGVTARCDYARCTTKLGKAACLLDRGCLYLAGACLKPACAQHDTQKGCDADPQCFFFVGSKSCNAAQCVSNTDLEQCEQGEKVRARKQCIWQGGKCRQPSYAEQNAPPTVDSCVAQVDGPMWWLYVYAAAIVLLVAAIIGRLCMARGGNLFNATRKNYQFNPHAKYAEDLFSDAQERADETNLLDGAGGAADAVAGGGVGAGGAYAAASVPAVAEATVSRAPPKRRPTDSSSDSSSSSSSDDSDLI